MIAVIRITGRAKLREEIIETLNRLNLKRKFWCIVFEKPGKIEMGMINKVKDFVAFGELNHETYKLLVEKRGGKIKNFFRLHPPRKGINSKLQFPKGVLGNNKEKINDLIQRML